MELFKYYKFHNYMGILTSIIFNKKLALTYLSVPHETKGLSLI